jgi:hypothetical protein
LSEGRKESGQLRVLLYRTYDGDVMTKALARDRHEKLNKMMGFDDFGHSQCESAK